MNKVEKPALYDVIIVGAGLAGLTAARRLLRARKRVCVLEAQEDVGGRIQTDAVDGYLLDRGFQVFLTSYPTASTELDLTRLQLGLFRSGALVRINGRFERVSDPWRNPAQLLSTAFSSVGSLRDKALVGWLRADVVTSPPELLLLHHRGETMNDYLQKYGFSERMIDRFFRPFFGGIFLDRSLQTSASMFRYLFRMFSTGSASLPADGMRAIPLQIAHDLAPDVSQCNSTVCEVTPDSVTLDCGQKLGARNVVLATEATAMARLLNIEQPEPFKSSVCFYYAADKTPNDEAVLMLNGDQPELPINSVVVLSNAQPSYAPPSKHLISVSCIGHSNESMDDLRQRVQVQLGEWFPEQFRNWRFLRAYSVPHSLPDQSPSAMRYNLQQSGIWLAGDYTRTGSIEGAIESGLRVANSLIH